MSGAQINFVRQQGFKSAAADSCSLQYPALMFQPRVIGVLVLAGVILQSPLLFLALAAVLFWSALMPGFNPFDAVYNLVVARPKRGRLLTAAPAPRRFAQALAAGLMVLIAASLLAGWTVAAWLVEGLLLAALGALIFGAFCLGSYLFHVVSGNGEFARRTLPWRITALLLGLAVCAQAADTSPARLQPQPGIYRISGRVVDSRGAPPSGLELTVGTEEGISSFGASPVPLGADGSFRTAPLAPGTYVLEVGRPGRSKPGEAASEGELRIIRVTTSDVLDVVVRTHPSYAITGRFRMESDNPAAVWPSQIVVGAWVAFDGAGFLGASAAEGASGGKFVLRDVYGPRVLKCGYSNDGRSRWWPGQVLLDGVDITDVPTDFSTAQARVLEVVFTQHPARVAGRVTDSRSRPVPQAWIVLIPADRARRQRWSAGAKAVQADFKGVFDFASLPGRYLATAVPPQMWLTRERLLKDLERFSQRAVPVELKDRERRPLTLRIN